MAAAPATALAEDRVHSAHPGFRQAARPATHEGLEPGAALGCWSRSAFRDGRLAAPPPTHAGSAAAAALSCRSCSAPPTRAGSVAAAASDYRPRSARPSHAGSPTAAALGHCPGLAPPIHAGLAAAGPVRRSRLARPGHRNAAAPSANVDFAVAPGSAAAVAQPTDSDRSTGKKRAVSLRARPDDPASSAGESRGAVGFSSAPSSTPTTCSPARLAVAEPPMGSRTSSGTGRAQAPYFGHDVNVHTGADCRDAAWPCSYV